MIFETCDRNTCIILLDGRTYLALYLACTTSNMPLMQLPTEIHLELLPTLDYESLINLTSTNHHFRSLRTDKLINSAFLHLEHVYLERRLRIQKERGEPDHQLPQQELEKLDPVYRFLPCYSCLKLRRRKRMPCGGREASESLVLGGLSCNRGFVDPFPAVGRV